MKKLFVLAALLMATPSAHAGNSISFQIEGHKIRVDAPQQLQFAVLHPDHRRPASPAPASAASSRKAPATMRRCRSPRRARARPGARRSGDRAAAGRPRRQHRAGRKPRARRADDGGDGLARALRRLSSTSPAPAAAPAAAPQPAPVAAAPAPAPTTPLGIWATEENKGNVRIEECGQNLCGYAVKTGKKILINMKPQASKWTGTIHDPDSGRNYDSTIAMKGTNALRVQGCAFGGMFCGGQTWKRVS